MTLAVRRHARRLLAAACLAHAAVVMPQPAQAQAEPFIGQLAFFGFNFCPRGWAPAQGQLLSISENTALFSLLGTQYGGDGRTSFALPDLRGRVPLGQGTGPGLSAYRMGEQGGVEQVTLDQAQMPSHTHPATTTVTVAGTDAGADAGSPAGALPANTGRTSVYATSGQTVAMNPGAAAATTTVAPAGGGQAHENRAPFTVANWCIAVQGIFPSRN